MNKLAGQALWALLDGVKQLSIAVSMCVLMVAFLMGWAYVMCILPSMDSWTKWFFLLCPAY